MATPDDPGFSDSYKIGAIKAQLDIFYGAVITLESYDKVFEAIQRIVGYTAQDIEKAYDQRK